MRLDTLAGSNASGTTVTVGAFLEIADCTGGASQQWQVLGQHIRRQSNADVCVDTLGGLTYDYISAVLNPCSGQQASLNWDV